MPSRDRVDQGLKELLQRAIDLDQRGIIKEACRLYLTASKILLKLSKSATLPRIQKLYFNRAQECVARVMYLSGIKKKDIQAHPRQTKPPEKLVDPTTGVTTRELPEVDSEMDEDSRRLQEMISDTIISERPDVKLSDVAGLEDAKQAVYEAVAAPLKHPELFKGKSRQPWRGILLYGPAGTGKTLLAKAVASEINATFFNVSAANIVSKWLGESERLVMNLFELARKNQPAVIFIDELDSIGGARSSDDVGGERRLKTQLLTELQGLGSNQDDRVTLVGATNLPWEIDFALISRFEKRILIPLPDKIARKRIFEIHMEEVEISKDVDYEELADLTEGFSGREIGVICREAAMEPVRDLLRSGRIDDDARIEEVRAVVRDDFLSAIDNIIPVTSPEKVRRYIEWSEGS